MSHPTIAMPDELAQIIATHRDLFGGFVMEVEDDPADPPPEGDPADDGTEGYPERTPVKDMTPEQQAAYWKAKSRGWEDKAKAREDYDAIKAERDQLKQSTMTADEKAIEDAKQQAADEARAEERAKLSGRLVSSELRGALRGRGLSEDRIKSLVGPLDHTYFLTDQGEVDADKVSDYAGGFTAGTHRPDTGQGRRGSATRSKESGSELYDRHYGKK